MKTLPSFLRFKPIYFQYLWGGNRIHSLFRRGDGPENCAESWEISAHRDGDSTVADGVFSGRTLSSLVAEHGRALLGSRAKTAARFPLLCKIIDAKQSLSVQVHPSPVDPSADPNEYKNECWHCLESVDGATIFAGLKDGIGGADALRRLYDNDPKALGEALVRHLPREGETLYIPAGLVHAIGAGSLIYEVQQSSNTTYRLYDWGRVGTDGKPRQLHFEEALRSIDFSLPPPAFKAPVREADSQAMLCLSTPYFEIREYRTEALLAPKGETFHILFCKRGGFGLEADGERVLLRDGDSLLVPAWCSGYSIKPLLESSSILVTTL